MKHPIIWADSLDEKQWKIALQWVTYTSERYTEIFDRFIETGVITPTLRQIATEPIKIKGSSVIFPADLASASGRTVLIKVTAQLLKWRVHLPYLLCIESKKIIATKTWPRKDTQANWTAFVNTVITRMAIEGKTSGLVFADDSINIVMKEVHGKSLRNQTLRIFKESWAGAIGCAVSLGVKDHHDKGTTYKLALDVYPHGNSIYPYASQIELDRWLEPYEMAYGTLWQHEIHRSEENLKFKNQRDKVVLIAEEIINAFQNPRTVASQSLAVREVSIDKTKTSARLVVRGRVWTYNEGIIKTDLPCSENSISSSLEGRRSVKPAFADI